MSTTDHAHSSYRPRPQQLQTPPTTVTNPAPGTRPRPKVALSDQAPPPGPGHAPSTIFGGVLFLGPSHLFLGPNLILGGSRHHFGELNPPSVPLLFPGGFLGGSGDPSPFFCFNKITSGWVLVGLGVQNSLPGPPNFPPKTPNSSWDPKISSGTPKILQRPPRFHLLLLAPCTVGGLVRGRTPSMGQRLHQGPPAMGQDSPVMGQDPKLWCKISP